MGWVILALALAGAALAWYRLRRRNSGELSNIDHEERARAKADLEARRTEARFDHTRWDGGGGGGS